MFNEKDQDILDFVSGYDKSKTTQEGHPEEKIVIDKQPEEKLAKKEVKDEFSSLEIDFFSVDKKEDEKEPIEEKDEKASQSKSAKDKTEIKKKENEKPIKAKDKAKEEASEKSEQEKSKQEKSKQEKTNKADDKNESIIEKPKTEKEQGDSSKVLSEEESESKSFFDAGSIDANASQETKPEIEAKEKEIKPPEKKDKLGGLEGFIALDSSVSSIEDISINDEDLNVNDSDSKSPDKKTKSQKEKQVYKPTKEQIKARKKEIKQQQEIEKQKWSTYHNNFVLAEGEKVIRDYQCLKVMNSKGLGVISVTNKRLLCSASEMAETELDNISGLTYKYRSGFNMFRVMMFFLLGSIAAVCFLMSQDILINLTQLWETKKDWFNIVLYSVGGILGLIAFVMLFTVHRKEFKVVIHIKASTSLVSYSGFKGNMRKNTIRVAPGKEAKNLAHELGALLLEIKAGKYQ